MYFYFKSKYNKEDKNIFNQKHYEIYSKRLRDLLSYKKKRLTRKEAYLAALVSMEHIKSQGKNFKGEPMWNTHDLFSEDVDYLNHHLDKLEAAKLEQLNETLPVYKFQRREKRHPNKMILKKRLVANNTQVTPANKFIKRRKHINLSI